MIICKCYVEHKLTTPLERLLVSSQYCSETGMPVCCNCRVVNWFRTKINIDKSTEDLSPSWRVWYLIESHSVGSSCKQKIKAKSISIRGHHRVSPRIVNDIDRNMPHIINMHYIHMYLFFPKVPTNRSTGGSRTRIPFPCFHRSSPIAWTRVFIFPVFSTIYISLSLSS